MRIVLIFQVNHAYFHGAEVSSNVSLSNNILFALPTPLITNGSARQ